jgi:hypothetical protein
LRAQHNPAETLNIEPVRYEQKLNPHNLGLSDESDDILIREEKNIRPLLALLLDLISRRWRPLDHGQTGSSLMKLSMARDSPTLEKLILLLEHLATPCRSSDPAIQLIRFSD